MKTTSISIWLAALWFLVSPAFSGEVSAAVLLGEDWDNPFLQKNISFQNIAEVPVNASLFPDNNLKAPTYPDPFPESDSLVLFAGNDTTICLTGLYIEVSGVAQNFYYTSWATTGDGFFTQDTSLKTEYFPGLQDIANGVADIYLVGIIVEPQYVQIIDSLRIEIVQPPVCFAGIDDFLCEGDTYQANAEATSFSELIWNTSGDGTFANINTLSPTYFHGSNDLANGQVLLELVAFPNAPCIVPDFNLMTLNIIKKPIVNAGNDTILCEGQTVQLNAEVINGNGVFWSSAGDGTFTEMMVANPVYIPGPVDIENGGCMLAANVATVFPCEPCPGDSLWLEIIPQPDVSIGGDQTICENEPLSCNATVENFESLQWQVLGGNGYFEDASQMNTIYHPGEHEKTTGMFYIILIVTADHPCNSGISAFFKVDIVNQAIISGGPDQLICSTDTANFYSMGLNFEDVFWETNGDGSFLGDNQLSRKYVPGIQDIQNGIVEIYICATSSSPCDVLICDTVALSFQQPAEINAGPDVSICQDVLLAGEVEHSTQIYWSTTGDGTFENQNALETVYHAGTEDIENLNVTLSLFAESQSPCETLVSDNLSLIIDRPVLEFAELSDQEVFAGESVSMSLLIASQQEVSYQWYHNGDIINGQNTSQLVLNNCQPTEAGRYYCMYWNDCFSYCGDTAMITVYSPSSQMIAFTDGWNAVSSYVLPSSTEIEVVLSPIIDEIVILYGSDGVFYPGQDVQTFSNWDDNKGYIFKTTSAVNLNINGFVKHPADEVTLQPGWSLLPVAQGCPVAPDILFGDFSQITVIKEVGGYRICWPDNNIFTLENINPGKAYEVFNASDEDVTITFPGCDD